jgi:hypothetical protein
MHIFTYKWHDNGLSSAQITELKEMIGNRTLVLFQNFPASAADSFPGGTFNPNEGDETRGMYAYSAEDGVMDRDDWLVLDLGDTTPSQAVHVYGDVIINVDINADTDADMMAHITQYIEADEKAICIAGHMATALSVTGYSTVKSADADTSYAMAKTGNTIAGLEKWQYGVGADDLKPIGFRLD